MARLTKRVVEGVGIDPAHDIYVWDTELPGFGVRVKPSGRRSFFIQYRDGSGRSRRVTLGIFGPMTVEQARKLAAHHLSGARLGVADVAAQRDAQRPSATVAALADRYLAEHATIRKKASSVIEDRRIIERMIRPRLGSVVARNLKPADIQRLHNSMKDTPVMANRVVALLSKMFSLAEEWGEIEPGLNPCRGLRKFREQSRERLLTAEELQRLGRELAMSEGSAPRDPEDADAGPQLEPVAAIAAIRLLIFTGCRKSEILGLRWEMVDLHEGCLRLPDSKTGRKVVYLNDPAVAVLAGLGRGDAPWVIPGRRGRFVGLQKVWERVRARAGLDDVRLHDLRHFYASVAVVLGEPLPVVGKLLGHARTATTDRYAHLADDPLRDASQRIGTRLEEMLLNGPEDSQAQKLDVFQHKSVRRKV